MNYHAGYVLANGMYLDPGSRYISITLSRVLANLFSGAISWIQSFVVLCTEYNEFFSHNKTMVPVELSERVRETHMNHSQCLYCQQPVSQSMTQWVFVCT